VNSTPEVMRLGATPGVMALADATHVDFWKRYFA